MTYTKAPGIEDIFPDKISNWNRIINSARKNFAIFNFKEIIIPIMEFTDLFTRGLGNETDIVSKEMFTFEDRGGRSLTLRPEGTASVVRAYCENGDYNRLSVAKFFYVGPMFRAEKPQKGRLRQFNQLGAELFGDDDPYYDFEIISMMDSIAKDLKIANYEILLNSIGCPECRTDYILDLKKYYSAQSDLLCEDCNRRLDKNPLRLLDCKKASCSALKINTPIITSYICQKCSDHYQLLKNYLNYAQIDFTENPYLVRGLDYYSQTVFEFVASSLGGQNAFAAGGRYNGLVETLGGKPTPAVGFAAGIERLIILTENKPTDQIRLDVYIVYSNEESKLNAIRLSSNLRNAGISVDLDPISKSFKSQLKKSERENARFAVIIGDDEISQDYYSIKNIDSREQLKIPCSDIIAYFKKAILNLPESHC